MTDVASFQVPAAAQKPAAGSAVHLLTDDTEMTTQDAADFLGISRTYVVRLVDNGKIPALMVGTHRRLRAADVLEYKARRDTRLAGVDAGVPYR